MRLHLVPSLTLNNYEALLTRSGRISVVTKTFYGVILLSPTLEDHY